VNDVVVVGEALVDIVQRLDGSTEAHPGGSPANVSLGLARLGREVGLLTKIGDDEQGLMVRAHLESSGVRLLPGSVNGQPTSTATAHLDPAGGATYDFDLDWSLPDQLVLPAHRALHTGSIAAFLPPGGDAVLALVEQQAGRATISYDPNARPALMGAPGPARERVQRFVAAADVVKVSDEDLAWLAPGADPLDVIDAWLAAGPSLVVLTRGGEGAVALCRAGRVELPAPRITVVDTVGAGDSFMSGLLDRLLEADLLGADRSGALRAIGTGTVESVLRHAVRIAAVTCGRAGANPPTRAELEATA
jgi:fructokinase